MFCVTCGTQIERQREFLRQLRNPGEAGGAASTAALRHCATGTGATGRTARRDVPSPPRAHGPARNAPGAAPRSTPDDNARRCGATLGCRR